MNENFNIAALMEAQAAERPYQRAVVFPAGRDPEGHIAWTELTFEALNRLTDAYARGLLKMGVRRGDLTSLLIRPSLQYIPLVFAIFKIGAIPVMIDPGMGLKRFLKCLQHAAPRVLIAEPMVFRFTALGFGRSALKSVEIKLATGSSWFAKNVYEERVESDEPFHPVEVKRDDLAAILFTSGSTGPAKGVLYTHGILHTQTGLIRDMYGIQGGEIDLACFGLFGLFSMAIGMTVVIPEIDQTKLATADPAKVVQALQEQACTSAFGSPAVWKRVAPYCLEHHIRLPRLNRILSSGAPVPVSMHRDFAQILNPQAEFHAPYGATESLPVATLGSHEILSETAERTLNGEGICVGYPVSSIEVRIVKISDEPIERWSPEIERPQGQIGEICVGGPMVTRAYDREPGFTAAAKIAVDPGLITNRVAGDVDLLHRIGDVGYIDEKGRLWFCGRKAHRVQLRDGSLLFPVNCEAIFNQHPAVARTALVGVEGEPVLVVELKPGQAQTEALKTETLQLGQSCKSTQAIRRLLYHPGFPVDVRHNAKIDREVLAAWARHQK